MRSTRLMLAVTALSTALALTACSDDGGDDTTAETPSGGQSSPTASESALAVPATGCRAEVEVEGDASDSWTGKGYVSKTEDADLYRASTGKKRWVFLNVGKDDSVDLVVGIDGQNRHAKPGDVDVESQDAGVGVTAKLPVKGGTATVTATFACADA